MVRSRRISRRVPLAATATSDTVVPTTDAKGAQGKKALSYHRHTGSEGKEKVEPSNAGSNGREQQRNERSVVDSAAVAEAKQSPLTKKRKKSNSPGSKTGAKETKVDPSTRTAGISTKATHSRGEKRTPRQILGIPRNNQSQNRRKKRGVARLSHRTSRSVLPPGAPPRRQTTTTTIPTATTKGFVRDFFLFS